MTTARSTTPDRGGVDSEEIAEIAETFKRLRANEAGDNDLRAREMAGLDANEDVRRAGIEAAHRARALEVRTDEVRVLTQQRAALWGLGSAALVSVAYMMTGPVGGILAGVAACLTSKSVRPDRALRRRVLQ